MPKTKRNSEEPIPVATVAEINLAARLAAKLATVPPVRKDMVDSAKKEIAAGRYPTPERLRVAAESLLKEARGEEGAPE